MRDSLIIISTILPLALGACSALHERSSLGPGLSGGSGRTLSLTFGPNGEVETVSVDGGNAYRIEELPEAFPPTVDKGTLTIVPTLILRVENRGGTWCHYSVNGHLVYYPC
jgi:hypothetical protein